MRIFYRAIFGFLFDSRLRRMDAADGRASATASTSQEPFEKRIHVAGLNANITRKALEERFASYGTVVDVDGCEAHHVDAVGTCESACMAHPRQPSEVCVCDIARNSRAVRSLYVATACCQLTARHEYAKWRSMEGRKAACGRREAALGQAVRRFCCSCAHK